MDNREVKEKTKVLNEKRKELVKNMKIDPVPVEDNNICKDEIVVDRNVLNDKIDINKKESVVDVKKLENNQTKNMIITTEQIKKLRDQTNISIMQCKKALEEAGGDFDKAVVILRKKSGEISAKKADRTFNAGVVQAYIHSNGTVGTILELNCESDFVANNEEFKNLARDIAMHVTATNPKFIKKTDITEDDTKTAKEVFEAEVKGKPEEVRAKILDGKLNAYFAEMVLMDQPFIKNPERTVQDLIDSAVQKFGEKMAVSRFKRFKILEQ